MIAIDLPGADPKVRAMTTTSQPQAMSATAPAIRRNCRSELQRCVSIVIEVLNTHAFSLEIAIDVDETVDPSLQAGAAEAGLCIQLQ